VLAWVAFCSTATREAMANALAQKLSYPPEEFAKYFDLGGDYKYRLSFFTNKALEFIAVTGNARTAELLEKAARSADYNLAEKVRDTAKSVRARLALPEPQRSKRTQDELVFWRALECDSSLGKQSGREYDLDAALLSAHDLSVSASYLIEQLEHPCMVQWARESHPDPERTSLAIAVIGQQKENIAVPALAKFARSYPEFRNSIAVALKQIGTPDATKALKELSAVKGGER
jgi:hypothetical protein